MKFLALILILSGCLKPKVDSPDQPVYEQPLSPPPPLSTPPRPGFIALDRLEDIMVLDAQNITNRQDRENTRYLIACDRTNQGLSVGEYEQGLNIAMNRLSNERFTSTVTPVGQAGCIFRINKDDYSISDSDWKLIERSTILDVVPDTNRNRTLQFLTQTLKPYIFGVETLVMYEADEVSDQAGAVYYTLTDQANLTTDFLEQEGINLQDEVDSERAMFSGFSQSQIALGKTRLVQVIESDNGFCMGTLDTVLGGDDLFENPFSKELALAGGRVNSKRVLDHQAQEWICSLNNGMFGKWRLNNAINNDFGGGFAEVEAPTNIVINVNNAAIDGSIRIGDCNECHYLQVAIPFADAIGPHLKANSAFGAQEKLLGEVFFRYDKISAVINDINSRHSRALEDLGVTAAADPLTQVIWKPFRAEMNVAQVAAFTFQTPENFITLLQGTDKSSQVFGSLVNGGTVSLATLKANYVTLIKETGLFRDNEL